jgi:hypothetical protein
MSFPINNLKIELLKMVELPKGVSEGKNKYLQGYHLI